MRELQALAIEVFHHLQSGAGALKRGEQVAEAFLHLQIRV